MKKRHLLIPVLVGLVVGQIFAEGDRPFTVVNTLRFGYDDNVYRTSNNQEESAYIQDLIELSFNAALSERTDFVFNSRFDVRSDKESNIYPNLYAMLTHSASPRLLLQLSDKFTSGSQTSAAGAQGKYNYYYNTLAFTPSYVLSSKDSISAPVSYTIKRQEEKLENIDADIISAGLSWKRQLSPERTWAALAINQRMTDYINRDSTYDSTLLTTELSHTFNPQWYGNVKVGASFDKSDSTFAGVNTTSESVNPYISAGLTYEPSPATRLTANVSQKQTESSTVRTYTAGQSRAISLGAQHDFTAKIKGKVTARYQQVEYDQRENETGVGGSLTEEYFDVDLRVSYKINRINSLELGMRHREKAYDTGNRDWDQNMVDVGWRVEL
jgi:hypothetical protein